MTQALKTSGPNLPNFGDALPVKSSVELLDRLATRRSCSAQTLVGPAPTDAELETLLTLGMRVPDHGKLFPWRFIVLKGVAKETHVQYLQTLAPDQKDPVKAKACLAKLSAPPLAIIVVSKTDPNHKIPVWEQELSAGAVCQNLLLAALGLGYGANWITDWYSYEQAALSPLGLSPQERVAGFVYVGTPSEAPLERPRPILSDLVTYL